MRSPITSHVLDAQRGQPAQGVQVELKRENPSTQSWDLAYFTALGQTSFYPFVEVHFRIDQTSDHYHIPLLLSSHSYTTYRGS
ncbi:hypothetical protein IWQ61_005820 [Dispira simplex]|nr:hypothetical protein IWQ61_005820 [Dispira simplex]